MQGKTASARTALHCTALHFQTPSTSGSLKENENEKYIIFLFEWRVKSAVLPPDWFSTGIKVHVLIDCGDKSRVFTPKCCLVACGKIKPLCV